jgi:two-component system, LytTR family, sensor kinase
MSDSKSSVRVNTIIYGLAWLVIFIAHSLLLYYQYGLSAYFAMADSLIFNFNFALLGLGIWYIARFNDITKNSILVFILNHTFSMAFIVIIWLFASNLILKSVIDDKRYNVFLDFSYPWRIITGVLYYALIGLVYYVFMYYANFQKKIKSESELRSLVKEAELASLKNQINPHFLFNSLNSISSLTITNPEKAREMLVKLSELMRYSLKTTHNDRSSLSFELDNIEKYIALEKVRFGNKLEYEKEVDETCCAMLLPNMILQPLFENAIKHGIYESTEKVTIKVKCKAINNVLQICIENNFDITGKPMKGEGIGLDNIKKRLTLIYKNPDLLSTEIKNNFFIAKLLIPQN